MAGNYKCSKCNGTKYRKGEAWLSGSFWKRVLNVNNRHFVTHSCNACGYTEFYEKMATTAKGKRKEKMEEVLEVLID